MVPETMSRLLVMPAIRSSEELSALACRLAWYLGRSSFRECVIFVDDAALSLAEWSVAEELDPEVAQAFPLLRPRLRFRVGLDEAAFREELITTDLILLWRENVDLPFLPGKPADGSWEGRACCVVDPERERNEGSAWLELNRYLRLDREMEPARQREKFAAMCVRLGNFRRAYAIASGPSYQEYPRFDYRDSLVVVCNSVIRDAEFLDRVKPQILVFADPIFQFGPSRYAADFRACLRAAAARHSFDIIIPLQTYGFFTDLMPDLRDRTIGVPAETIGDANLDLRRRFEVVGTANILTFLMLPLAATFAREVCIVGCDGRPPEANQYFWQHNSRVQFNDRMENIRKVHPAFFAVDYDDYYSGHCENLGALLASGEALGHTFKSLTFSHIPALVERRAAAESVLVITENSSDSRVFGCFDEAWFVSTRPALWRADEKPAIEGDESLVLGACVLLNPSVLFYTASAGSAQAVALTNELARRCPGAMVFSSLPVDGLERCDGIVDPFAKDGDGSDLLKNVRDAREGGKGGRSAREARYPVMGPFRLSNGSRLEEDAILEDFCRELGIDLPAFEIKGPACLGALRDRLRTDAVDFLRVRTTGLAFDTFEVITAGARRSSLIVTPFCDRETAKTGFYLRKFCARLREAGYLVFLSEWHVPDSSLAWFRLLPQGLWPVSDASAGLIIAVNSAQLLPEFPSVSYRRRLLEYLLGQCFRKRLRASVRTNAATEERATTTTTDLAPALAGRWWTPWFAKPPSQTIK